MLAQIAQLLIDTAAGLFVFLLLARFHFQWLRISFRNQVGGFIIAMTNWIVMPLRRAIPGVLGVDLASLLAALAIQMLGLYLVQAVIGRPFGGDVGEVLLGLAALALVDLVRLSIYLLVFAVLLQVVLSWVNPYSPAAPALNAALRPFMRPLRRAIPPIGNFDLSPLVLLLLLQVILIPLAYLRAMVERLL